MEQTQGHGDLHSDKFLRWDAGSGMSEFSNTNCIRVFEQYERFTKKVNSFSTGRVEGEKTDHDQKRLQANSCRGQCVIL